MIKILYTISTLQKSGPSIVLYNLIQGLDRTYLSPLVLTLSAEKQESLKDLFIKKNIPVLSLNLSRLNSFFLGRLRLAKILKQEKPFIIHANGFRDICLVALAASKYKKVATIHCDFDADYQMKYGKFVGKLMAALQWKALQHFSSCICVSHSLADILNQRQHKIHFDYVNNGVDTAIFSPVTAKSTLRKELGLPLNKVIFIWVGSFIHRKNPLCLVDAIKKIKVQNAFFVFCGARGPLLETAKQQLQDCKNVLFTGYTNKVARYLQASDCYISTSLSEGFHLSVYEALACGLPVILSDLDIYDEIKPTGCSFVFSPAKSEELQTKILDFLAHSDTEFSDRAVTFIKQGFSTETMSLKYQEHYKELLVI